MDQKYCFDDPLFEAICSQEKNRFGLDEPKLNRYRIENIFNDYVKAWNSAPIDERARWLHWRGWTNKQIAWQLRINLKTVRRFLKSARKAGILSAST